MGTLRVCKTGSSTNGIIPNVTKMKNQIHCLRHSCIEKDIKNLRKRFPLVDKDFEHLERLLRAGIPLPKTESYPGFGQRNIKKIRVVNTAKNKGKVSGYRLIYEEVEGGEEKTINEIMLYDHNSIKDEHDVKGIIGERLNEPNYLNPPE